jgi:hypothetical protein
MTFILFYVLSSPVNADDLSVQDELKAMKVQMQNIQAKMADLEAKVSSQQAAKQVYEDRIKNLEEQLAEKQTVMEPAASGRSTPIKWTPEIGAMADTVFTSSSTKEDTEGANRLSLRELELILGSNIDPFSRLDVVISFSDSEDPSLEEAYMTRFGLPFHTTARLGQFKPKVGKVLGAHRDSLDTVDEPLVIQRYFGVEGMSKSGLDLTAPIDLPWPVTQQLTVGVLEGGNGEDGTAFGTARRTPTLYSHLKNYVDLTDLTGIEVGISHMAGSGGDEPGFDAQVLGADVTLTQHLGTQTLKWQNEVFNLNRRKSVDVDGNLWGAYGLLDYHFHPQWSLGFRYDYAQLVDNPATNPHNADVGQTGYLTFYQSEFARWRAQYKHTSLATGKDDNTVYVQGTFVIGDHKHKLQ